MKWLIVYAHATYEIPMISPKSERQKQAKLEDGKYIV